MKLKHLTAGACAAALAVVLSAGMARANAVEKVRLEDKDGMMTLKATKTELPAGKVTFEVSNAADSTSQHEMIVVGLTPGQAAHLDKLPTVDDGVRLDEEKINDRGEVSELDPGQSGSLTITLKPGLYMLLCNVPGHFSAGMHELIHVK
ncbi:Uncharacterized copper-binding protein, cupredoxin-like subfamily [Tistlia consotensis]|uniref:Uncharacterized copper-binding protein, cupredoxin-like subfamily n=1 Tax=Tistlia consotensis USBA 355 TaxID=560819 RepID=A0A1Y6BUI0_9PROT|nr:plastocyanin/azurin family copper-binding protein [Tistlia consotensis]SMF29155.1 Uncharacterized copper-binding protein, cupredoxin-like subfamily [Tistlia consotensis USBA 355]SNR91573.1 Uncharacterized copper-binding protein, cupredoxin-like subfamily [Tistlia consotensis]